MAFSVKLLKAPRLTFQLQGGSSMKNKMKRTIIVTLAVLTVGIFSAQSSFGQSAFDRHQFEVLTLKNINVVTQDDVNPSAVTTDMLKLIEMGKQGCRAHMENAATPQAEKEMMRLILAQADQLPTLTIDEIEEQYHDGEFMKKQGIDLEQFDHFSTVMGLYDTVIHPATVIILMREYEKNGDKGVLVQASDELKEIFEHLKYIK
jgi:hypothetical protein